MPPEATVTSLSIYPASPVARGTAVTVTAAVPPAAAAGTVQFRNGGIDLGDPVSVTTGTAMGGR